MYARNAEVIAVVYADPAGAGGTRFFDGHLHAVRRYNEAQACVAIDNGGRRTFMYDPDVGAGIDTTGFPQPYITYEPGDAMTVDATEVGRE